MSVAQPIVVQAHAPSDWRTVLRLAWTVYWPMRLLLLVIGIFISLATANGVYATSLAGWLQQVFIAPWHQVDVVWYVRIAQDGYSIADGRAAFHPLLPLLMGGLGRILGGQYVLAGLIINDLACFGLLAVFYRFVALDYGESVGVHSMRWLLANPMGWVLLIPYTEALTLFFIVQAFWYARHDRWLAAGLCGCLATLAKQPAIVLVVALFVEFLYRHHKDLWRWRSMQILASLTLIPLGYLAYSAYRLLLNAPAQTDLGSTLRALVVSPQLGQKWGSTFIWPTDWLVHIIKFSFGSETYLWYWIEVGLFLAALFVLSVILRRMRPSLVVYSLIQLFLIMTILQLGDALMSSPRRFLLVFVIPLQLGIWSAKSRYWQHWRIISLALQGLLIIGFITEKFTP